MQTASFTVRLWMIGRGPRLAAERRPGPPLGHLFRLLFHLHLKVFQAARRFESDVEVAGLFTDRADGVAESAARRGLWENGYVRPIGRDRLNIAGAVQALKRDGDDGGAVGPNRQRFFAEREDTRVAALTLSVSPAARPRPGPRGLLRRCLGRPFRRRRGLRLRRRLWCRLRRGLSCRLCRRCWRRSRFRRRRRSRGFGRLCCRRRRGG